MATNKDKLMKGVKLMAGGIPFIFLGPVILTAKGFSDLEQGNYLWLIVGIIFLLTAMVLCGLGFKNILAAFFSDD